MKYPQTIFAGALLLAASVLSSGAMADTLPDCEATGVLNRVGSYLTTAEAHVVHSGDPVLRIDQVNQSKFFPDGPRSIAQRYCKATGHTELGQRQTIYYLIEARAGFAGYTYDVEACIPSRDPWKLYGANCRSLR